MFDELAQLSRAHEYEKEYRVLLARRPYQEQLEAWKRGVILEDGYKAAPVDVHFESAQGKGAVVRILWVRIGSLKLGNLRPRQWRYLTIQEINELKSGNEGNRRTKRL